MTVPASQLTVSTLRARASISSSASDSNKSSSSSRATTVSCGRLKTRRILSARDPNPVVGSRGCGLGSAWTRPAWATRQSNGGTSVAPRIEQLRGMTVDHAGRPLRCSPRRAGARGLGARRRGVRVIGRGVEDKVQPSLLFIPGTESTDWRDVREGSFNEALIVLLVGPGARDRAPGPAARGRAPAPRRDPRDLSVEPPRRAGRGAAAEPAARRRSASTCGSRPAATSTRSSGRSRTSSRRTCDPPVRAHLAGIPSLGSEVNKSSIEALHKGELIAAPILILVLLLVFRSPVAAARAAADRGGHGRHGLRAHLGDPRVHRRRRGRIERGVDDRAGAGRRLLAADRHALPLEPRRRPRSQTGGLDRGEHRGANGELRRRGAAGHHRGRVPPVAGHGPAVDGARDERRDGPQHDRRDPRRAGCDEPARPSDQQVADRRSAHGRRRRDLPDRQPGDPPRGAGRRPARRRCCCWPRLRCSGSRRPRRIHACCRRTATVSPPSTRCAGRTSARRSTSRSRRRAGRCSTPAGSRRSAASSGRSRSCR